MLQWFQGGKYKIQKNKNQNLYLNTENLGLDLLWACSLLQFLPTFDQFHFVKAIAIIM